MKRGTATVAALVMLTLVGVATAMLTARLADSAERTRRATTEAQARTMLLSAAALARTRLEQGAAIDGTIDVPQPNGEPGAISLRRADSGPQAASVIASARVGDVNTEAAFRFESTASGWQLERSVLNTTAN